MNILSGILILLLYLDDTFTSSVSRHTTVLILNLLCDRFCFDVCGFWFVGFGCVQKGCLARAQKKKVCDVVWLVTGRMDHNSSLVW